MQTQNASSAVETRMNRRIDRFMNRTATATTGNRFQPRAANTTALPPTSARASAEAPPRRLARLTQQQDRPSTTGVDSNSGAKSPTAAGGDEDFFARQRKREGLRKMRLEARRQELHHQEMGVGRRGGAASRAPPPSRGKFGFGRAARMPAEKPEAPLPPSRRASRGGSKRESSASKMVRGGSWLPRVCLLRAGHMAWQCPDREPPSTLTPPPPRPRRTLGTLWPCSGHT